MLILLLALNLPLTTLPYDIFATSIIILANSFLCFTLASLLFSLSEV